MTEKNNRTQRHTGLDLLRILSMFLIVLMHALGDSGVLDAVENAGTITLFLVRMLLFLTVVSVNCFVLISGYFLVNSTFRLSKIALLWLQVVFYAFTIKAFFMAVGAIPFSAISLISCFFPFLTARYWFFTIYVGMYLLSPFLNKLIHTLDKKQHTQLNCLLFFLFSVITSLHPRIAGMNSGGCWGVAWFVVLYSYAAWFRRYYEGKKHNVKGKIVTWITISALIAAFDVISKQFTYEINTIVRNWYQYDSVLTLISSLLLFSAFVSSTITIDRLAGPVSFTAKHTFGVYLIALHANMIQFVWQTVDLPGKIGGVSLFGVIFGTVIICFLGCIYIDALRSMVFGKIEKCTFLEDTCRRIEELFIKVASWAESVTERSGGENEHS